MKIVIIAHSLYPIAEPYAGGLEKITKLLVDSFVEFGHEVILFAKKDSQTKGHLIAFPTIDEFNKTFYTDEHEWLGFTREEMFQIYIYNWTMNQIHGLNADIIHNHSLHHVPIIRGIEFGKKFYTTFHTPIFTQLRFGLKCSQHVIDKTQFTTISKFQQNLYAEFTPSHLVYNGIEVDEWYYNIEQKKDYLFWMGRICKEKAPHLAAEACIKADIDLYLAGPISNEEYHKQHLEPLLNHPRIHYIGHIKKEDINDYLIDAKAYLFTSTWDEPYGLTIAEALACGTPVIAFDVGAASEIITSLCGFIIPKEDVDGLVAAFKKLNNITLSDCRKRAEAFCNIKKCAADYIQLYKTQMHENTIL